MDEQGRIKKQVKQIKDKQRLS